MCPFLYLLWSIWAFVCQAIPENGASSKINIPYQDALDGRVEYKRLMRDTFTNTSLLYEHRFQGISNQTEILVSVPKKFLEIKDNIPSVTVNITVMYNSTVPFTVAYDIDASHAVNLLNRSWYWLPANEQETFQIPTYMRTRYIGLSHLRVRIREANSRSHSQVQAFVFKDTDDSSQLYYDSIAEPAVEFNSTMVLEVPVVVVRGKGVIQLLFRIIIITMVTLFTFTMGCELDPVVLKNYSKKPIAPAIGFCCQFLIMPVIAFGIAKLVPLKPEFGFGLLTIGCSPGGGASNAWALMLGGDLNLSIMMTFISMLSSLFMMPLLLFIFGRWFIDVTQVRIPYGNICIQLLQIAIPALAGLAVRIWKPNVARRFKKFTRPMFIFFLIFFLTFGIYANWSIFKLLSPYPIVLPTGALLPWIGFALAALFAFVLCQSKTIIITVAIETGIQNVSAAILVLLYSMPQPAGDLGAVMPITVSLFTPIPLYFILMGLMIRRRCCQEKPDPSKIDCIDDPEVNHCNPEHNRLDLVNGHTGKGEDITV